MLPGRHWASVAVPILTNITTNISDYSQYPYLNVNNLNDESIINYMCKITLSVYTIILFQRIISNHSH